jgi:hypothetical protein
MAAHRSRDTARPYPITSGLVKGQERQAIEARYGATIKEYNSTLEEI